MKEVFNQALCQGAESVTAWADMLNDINVFPVADGDTGRNLTISLQPLKRADRDTEQLKRDLLLCARGNSGNISARFFASFIDGSDWRSLTAASKRGRDHAYRAVERPEVGTILSLFDRLVEALDSQPPRPDPQWKADLIEQLAATVKNTISQQPVLRDAGVVDAGALAMFFFFEAFFSRLIESSDEIEPVNQRFKDLLQLNPSWRAEEEARTCVDAVIRLNQSTEDVAQTISNLADEIVTIDSDEFVKIHFHTKDESSIRERLAELANVLDWKSDDMGAQTAAFRTIPVPQAVHIVTDAAGSVMRDDARELGISVLDSYVQIEDRSTSEGLLDPREMYNAMREGKPVSTSQASLFERHEHYKRLLSLYPRVLYLCVGSAYTGIYQTVMDWKRANDPENRLEVIDTGAASGRLGLLALATARFSRDATDAQAVVDYAKNALPRCKEFIFLDKLHYLARGGRLSKGSAFFGDMLHMKPVISPLPEGATKVAVLRNREQQVEFALEKVTREIASDRRATVLLQFSDNRDWLVEAVHPLIAQQCPSAEILLRPLSRTSGAHMGPGTWAIAYLQTSESLSPIMRPGP
jgi:DegV family protein with EDD domain